MNKTNEKLKNKYKNSLELHRIKKIIGVINTISANKEISHKSFEKVNT